MRQALRQELRFLHGIIVHLHVSEGIYRINFLPNSVKMVLHIPGACDILFECVVIMAHTDNN